MRGLGAATPQVVRGAAVLPVAEACVCMFDALVDLAGGGALAVFVPERCVFRALDAVVDVAGRGAVRVVGVPGTPTQ